MEYSNNELITFLGGIQIKNAFGEIIGAIAVIGSYVENDHALVDEGTTAI
ncbi:MAG: heme-binding protein [Xanthomarina sp.]